MVKRGLVISYYFPPGGGGGVQRWVKLIKYLKDFDWRFTVISSTPESNQPVDKSLADDIPEVTRVITVPNQEPTPMSKYFSSRMVKRGYWQRWLSALFNATDSRGGWNERAKKIILKETSEQNYDVLIISAPPYSLAKLAADLSTTLPMPVIFDLRDPWTINPYKIHPTFFHRFLDRRREQQAISRIGSIISAYRCTLDDYNKRIPSFKKKNILYLPNGYDEDDFTDLEYKALTSHADFRIGFSGSVYSHLNTPGFLFAAFGALQMKNIKIEFHHLGTSVYNLKSLAAPFNIEQNIVEWGYQPHRKCLAILNQMDALCLILDGRWRNSSNTVGGKFFEYLRLRKPIIALVPEEGEAADMIRETDSGIVISGQDPAQIAGKLLTIIQKKYSFAWQGVEQYDRKQQASDLNDFLLTLKKD